MRSRDAGNRYAGGEDDDDDSSTSTLSSAKSAGTLGSGTSRASGASLVSSAVLGAGGHHPVAPPSPVRPKSVTATTAATMSFALGAEVMALRSPADSFVVQSPAVLQHIVDPKTAGRVHEGRTHESGMPGDDRGSDLGSTAVEAGAQADSEGDWQQVWTRGKSLAGPEEAGKRSSQGMRGRQGGQGPDNRGQDMGGRGVGERGGRNREDMGGGGRGGGRDRRHERPAGGRGRYGGRGNSSSSRAGDQRSQGTDVRTQWDGEIRERSGYSVARSPREGSYQDDSKRGLDVRTPDGDGSRNTERERDRGGHPAGGAGRGIRGMEGDGRGPSGAESRRGGGGRKEGDMDA